MKKQIRKITMKMVTTALLSTIIVSTAVAGTWESNGGQWRYRNDAGQQISSSWVQDGNYSYLIDENGYMQIGWVLHNGKWYFLDTRIGGPQGNRMVGWQWIDGKCYYLDPAQNGAAVISGITTDGYRVDVTGAWIDEMGKPYYEVGKGISSTQIVDVRAAGPGGALATNGGNMAVSGSGGSGGGGGGGSSSGGSGGSSSGNIIYDDEWNDYSDDSVSHSANDFKNGNYNQMTSRQREQVKDAIEEFKETYFTEGMSDFEKEIMIIRWLVENCTYEKASGWKNSTAYSCIINGKAQCSGYADAFLQTAKSCGLEVRYVSNSSHAWNLIKLDGDWYHVDVTWEDPIGNNTYGFSALRNKYINLEDSEIRGVSSHRTWSPSSVKCQGSKYGPDVVSQYLKDGTIDTSKGESHEERINHLIDSIRNEDGSNIISFKSVEDASEKIYNYMKKQIEGRQSEYAYMVRYPSTYTSYKTGNYTKVSNFNREIRANVEERINSQYGERLKYKVNLYMFTDIDSEGNYLSRADNKLYYANETIPEKKYQYTIHYVDEDTKEEVGVQTGETERAKNVALEYPEGYGFYHSASPRVDKGYVAYTSSTFQILGREDIELTIYVGSQRASGSNITKATPSSASMS